MPESIKEIKICLETFRLRHENGNLRTTVALFDASQDRIGPVTECLELPINIGRPDNLIQRRRLALVDVLLDETREDGAVDVAVEEDTAVIMEPFLLLVERHERIEI